MQFTGSGGKHFDNVLIKHNGETLVWDTSWYSKATTSTVEEVFKEFNTYLSTIAFSRQTTIFNIYKDMHATLTDVFADSVNIKAIIQQVYLLYKEIPWSELCAFVDHESSGIRLPSSLLTEHGDQPQVRTYLRDDYRELVVFVLALRPMVPVWAEYIRANTHVVGSTYKEYEAMKLLMRSWLNVSKPRNRLLDYLESIIPKEPKNNAALLGGLGREELPEWILGLVCVRRCAISPLTSTDEKNMLISSIYNYVNTNAFNSMDRKFRTLVVDKHARMVGSSDDNMSYVEQYKVKQQLSDGDVTMLSTYVELGSIKEEDGQLFSTLVPMIEHIDPTVPLELVDRCTKAIDVIKNNEILLHHEVFTQWVINPAIPAAGTGNLNRVALMQCMALTQAVLHHWGFSDLAALVTASPRPVTTSSFGGETRPRIPKEIVERLVELYPYFHPTGVRPDATAIEKQRRQNNVAIIAIDTLSKELVNQEWNIYAPEEIVKATSGYRGVRRMPTPVDIKTQLANLSIKLATRNEWFGQ